ncbi:MAG: hypothetical protein ABI665_17480 [Vicinamibacterales bacterium]
MPNVSRRIAGVIALAVAAVASSSCGSALTRTSRSPMILVIDKIELARGSAAGSATFTSNLVSDVQTIVDVTLGGVTTQVATVFNDNGRATIRMVPKNPGTVATPTAPSDLNAITITRYHVTFRRTDGRNVPGVDVPYAFDGGTTATLTGAGTADVGFDAVRHSNKEEPPLSNLIGGGGARFINAIADVTFYGRDQVGNEVTVSGSFDVTFADFGD